MGDTGNGTNHLIEGFHLEKTYQIGVKFLREKEGRAFHLSYAEKNQLAALAKLIRYGPYDSKSVPDMGLLNIIGHDRIVEWKKLGDLSREDAQNQFIKVLEKACPQFRAVVEAHLCKENSDSSNKLQSSANSSTSDILEPFTSPNAHVSPPQLLTSTTSTTTSTSTMHANALGDVNSQSCSADMHEQFEQLRLEQIADQQRLLYQEEEIRGALKRQTYDQFRQYAEQQIPNDKAKQEDLIEQLHEQHYQQYMAQIYQQQLIYQQQMQQNAVAIGQQQQQQQQPLVNQNSPESSSYSIGQSVLTDSQQDKSGLSFSSPDKIVSSDSGQYASESSESTSISLKLNNEPTNHPEVPPTDVTQIDYPNRPTGIWDGQVLHNVLSACMWSRKDVINFKSVLKDDPEGIIQVGSGEVVTVRVPTHNEGSCLFWEFATDVYDIGFGLFFEFTKQSSSPSSLVVDPQQQTSAVPSKNSSESLNVSQTGEKLPDQEKDHVSVPAKENIASTQEIEIIPVFRRDCHTEVYCGSHPYPCQGVYLLRFDNSYSLWRSKTLYYRVYYSK